MVFQQKIDTVPSTRQLAIKNTNIAPASKRANIVYDKGVPAQLIFRSTQDDGKTVTFEINPIMVIGRKRSMRDYEVDVDLTDLNAADAGVSRYHAMLLSLDNHIHLKDIDSLNGSLLNGKRMTPSQEYILADRDTIAFGNLELRVEFVYD